MTVLARAITCATLFIGLVLVFFPAQVLSATGVARPARFGSPQLAGMIVAAAGATVAQRGLTATREDPPNEGRPKEAGGTWPVA